MKRYAMPKWWPLEKKTFNYVTTPNPGPHSINKSMSLGTVLRDIFGYAKTMKESITILNNKEIKVDGIRRKDRKFPIGLMDILQIGNDSYRLIPSKKGFNFKKIKGEEKNLKFIRLNNKKYLKKGKLQLNFYDGKNIIVDKDEYSTGDSIVYDIEKKLIVKSIKLNEGSTVLIIGGKNKGLIGKVKKMIKTSECGPNIVIVENEKHSVVTQKNQVYVIGKEKAEIDIEVKE